MKIFLIILISLLNFSIYSQTPFYYPGYPKKIDSLRGSTWDKSNIPMITDLDNDGQKEIVTVTIGPTSPYYMLYVIKSDGSNFQGFPKGFTEPIKDLASGDVDGNGYMDIVIRSKNFINVIDRFGNNLYGFPVTYNDNPDILRKFISIYDLDNDGKLEIIVSIRGELNVFNFDGQVRSGWPKRITGEALNNPAIGDIDNDGFAEIILTSYRQLPMSADSAALNIFRHNGDVFSSNWPVYSDSLYITGGASPSIYINKTNTDLTYIVVPAYINISPGSTYSLNRLFKYNIKGEIIERSYQETYSGFGTFSIGDIDRNGKLEHSSGTQFGEYVTAYNSDMSIMSGWPNQGGGEYEATVAIGRLSYDQNLNIAINGWYTRQPVGYGFVYAYKSDGSQLPWSPLRPIGLVEGISIADLNNDGSIEIIATSSKTGYDSYLHVWTIPGIPYTNEDFPWPQYGHDRYRSNQYGFIPPDEPVGIQPSSTIVPDKFSLHQNFPNPFNPATTIKFDILSNVNGQTSNVSLIIFDALGREIKILVNERLRAGTYSLTFDGSKYNSGVYFYRLVVSSSNPLVVSSSNPLTTGSYTESKKMLMVK